MRAGADTPIARAQIVAAKIGGQLSEYRTVESDASGSFRIPDLTPGTYRVFAQRDGYLQAEYGRRPASTTGIPVTVADGQTSPVLTVEMTPPGVIAGQVMENGRPARNVWVRALKATYFDGQPSLRVIEYAQTDDRGEYRLFDLPPGFYFVSALPPEPPRIEGDTILIPTVPSNANDNRFQLTLPLTPETLTPAALMRDVYVPVYHPGSTDLGLAMPIDVRPGTVTAGIALTLARTPTFSIRGRAVQGEPVTSLRVRVAVASRQPDTSAAPRSVDTRADSSFELNGVPPGRYFLVAQTVIEPGSARRTAVQQIDVVDRDVEGIDLTLEPGIAVKGRVSIDGTSPAAGEPPIFVQLQTMNGLPGYSALRIQPDGTFTIESVAPGDYRFRIIQAQRVPWIKEARFGGIDVLTMPMRIDSASKGRELEIGLGARTATIEARVLDRSQRPVAGALVVAVPDDARRNRSSNFRTATADADGRVRIDQVAPGEYRLFATVDIEAAAWQDPNVLRLHQARGEIVRLTESGTATLILRITP